MKLAAALAIAALATTMALGCGSSPDEGTQSTERAGTSEAPPGATATSCDTYTTGPTELQVTGVSCGEGRNVMLGWQHSASCDLAGSSRGSCSVRSFRCLTTKTSSGASINCARPGRSVSFRAQRG